MALANSTLETKLHLCVDGFDEDDLIDGFITSATQVCAHHMDMPAESLTSTAPSAVKAAALLLVGSRYENREFTAERVAHIKPTFATLLQPFRVTTAWLWRRVFAEVTRY